MYSLDVNFLKDRKVEEDAKKTLATQASEFSLGKNLPMLIGLGVLVLLPAATGSLLWLINAQTASTQARIEELDAQIAQLGAQNQQIQELEKQVNAINEETQALVSVFTQIKPWSALLQDVRDRVPTGVQIESIKQEAATPEGTIPLTIVGVARSYDDVNDLVLSLQQSNFLKAQKTVLTSAEITDPPIQDLDEEARQELSQKIKQGQISVVPTNTNLVALKDAFIFPKVVRYQVKTELGDIPASKLTGELTRKGAVGLVTRLRTLEQKGAIQP